MFGLLYSTIMTHKKKIYIGIIILGDIIKKYENVK